MRDKLLLIILLLASVGLSGCKDDSMSAGSSILDEDDAIYVKTDTFAIRSSLAQCDSIISLPDSFLLGEMVNKYGTLHADILAQFACPNGFEYPSTTKITGVYLSLCYHTWYGDGNTPIGINAYEMDLGSFDYAISYPTNIKPEDYVSKGSESVLESEKIIVASQRDDSIYLTNDATYYTRVRARMSDAFTNRFFSIKDFSSQEAFNKAFNGLYITSEFGSTTIINVMDISIDVEYSFTYNKAGRDTTVNDVKSFYANSEVRQVNRIEHTDQSTIYKELSADSTYYSYVVAPANLYARLSFPMGQMQSVIGSRIGDKRPYVNMAKVKVTVCNKAEQVSTCDDWSQPSEHMLLIKESALNRFFSKRELPSDTCAIIADLTKGTNKSGDTEYYYTYDMSSLLTTQLRHSDNPAILDMVLVPVDVITASANNTTYIVSIKQQQTVSATQLISAQNPDEPMAVEVVYSGF